MNDCQDGIQVYFATETQHYTLHPIYGHYELQPNDVNGRPYFKMGIYGFWCDGQSYWWIGLDSMKGQSIGFASYAKDVYCPHQFSELIWSLNSGTGWYLDVAGSYLVVTCKCIFIHNKTEAEFHFKK